MREAILADLTRLCREAKYLGRTNIQDGTKGGRVGTSAPRWIVVDEHVRDALVFAAQVSPAGSRNMVAPSESYQDESPGPPGKSCTLTTSKVFTS